MNQRKKLDFLGYGADAKPKATKKKAGAPKPKKKATKEATKTTPTADAQETTGTEE